MLKTLLKGLRFPLLLAGFLLLSLCAPSAGLLTAAMAATMTAGGENVGHVSRVQGQAFAGQGAEAHPLELGSLVHRKDVLQTGPEARLEVTMLDETKLTLGADTALNVERYDLGRPQGSVLLKLTKGVFRVATGQLAALRQGPFEVSTPLGVIGIRGTDFWGGYLSAEELSVLLLSGKGVYIKNSGGMSEIVRPLEGVVLRSGTIPPPAPSLWSPDKRARAFQSVAFD